MISDKHLMSNELNEIISFYLPNGLPSEEDIRKMSEDERNNLFEIQNSIITNFRKLTLFKLYEMEMKMMKATKALTSTQETKSEEPQTEEKIEKQKETTKPIEPSQEKQPKAKIIDTPQKSPKKTPAKTTTIKRQDTPRPTKATTKSMTKAPTKTPTRTPVKSPKPTPQLRDYNPKFKAIEDKLSSISSKIRQAPPPNPYIH